MSDFSDYVFPVALVAVGYLLVREYVLDPLTSVSSSAGAWVAENVVQPATTGSLYPTTSILGALEGYNPPVVPDTPSGYSPSNWVWDIGVGSSGNTVYLGLPEGMTPGQFCSANPSAPVCSMVESKPSILSEWYQVW